MVKGGIAILVLAAGASSRMGGRDKLLEEVDGVPLLQRICAAAAETGLVCYVTLPALDHARAAFTGTAAQVPVADAAEGMGASIRAGVAALPEDVEGVMILPADMPEIGAQALRAVAQGFQGPDGPVLRGAGGDGTPGHPVLFPRRCFAALLRLAGDEGARAVLRGEDVRLVPLAGAAALTDLDTPGDWAVWRKGRG